MATTEIRKGEKVKYIGKGFITFDKADTTMTYIGKDGRHDAKVVYKGMEMLVSDYEIKQIIEVGDVVKLYGKSRVVVEVLPDDMVKLNKELSGPDKSTYIIFKTDEMKLVAKGKIYRIEKSNTKAGSTPRIIEGTLEYLTEYFGYTLEIGNSHKKSINRKPKTIQSLVTNVQNAFEVKEGSMYNRTFIELLPDSE